MMSSLIGAGILGLPFFYQLTGYIQGPLITVAMSLVNIITSCMLLQVCRDVGGSGVYFTYEELARKVLGQKGFYLINLCIICRNFGVLVIYAIMIGNFWALTLPPSEWARDGMLGITMICVLLPLTLIRYMKGMWVFNLLGLLAAGYFSVSLLVDLGLNGGEQDALQPLIWTTEVFRCMSTNMLAFASATVVIPIWIEQEGRMGHGGFSFVIAGQIAGCVLCIATGLAGTLRWGEEVGYNVMDNYGAHNGGGENHGSHLWLVSIPAVYTAKLVMSFVIVSHILRLSLLVGMTNGHVRPQNDLNYVQMWCLEKLVMIAVLVVAIFLPSLSLAFTLTGGLFSCLTAIIVPSLIYLKHFKDHLPTYQVVGTVLLLCLGVVITVASLVLEILNLGTK